MSARGDGSVVAGGLFSKANITGGEAASFVDTEPYSGKVPLRVSAGGPATFRLCGLCQTKVSWEQVIYRVERIQGSEVTSVQCCGFCLVRYKATIK